MSADTLAAIDAARAANAPARLADIVPYAAWMGFEFESRAAAALAAGGDEPGVDGLVGVMRYSDMLVGNPQLPALHGGTLGALLETTAMLDLLWRADTAAVPRIVNITVEYLRAGKPRDTFARAHVTRLGRRIASVRAEAWQESPTVPIAAANAQFLLDPREGATP